jgi:mono/diheme cytochrome c family protein
MKTTLLRLTNLALVLAAGAVQAADKVTIERGQSVYQQWCIACHGPGQHTPGTMALFFKYEGKVPPMLEHRSDLNVDTLRVYVRQGVSVMPSFRKTEVSDADIDAIGVYLKHTAASFVPPKATK